MGGNTNLVDVDPVGVLPGPVDVRVRVARGLARQQDVVARQGRDVRRPGHEVGSFCLGLMVSFKFLELNNLTHNISYVFNT